MPLKPYDHTTYPATGSAGSSAALRAELELIEQGFDALALALENGISGAAGSATLATTKASEASSSATSAQTSATNAASSAASALSNKNLTDTASANAISAASDAEIAFQSFDVRYLGSKATAPTLDNNGQSLASGAMYFDTTLAVFRGFTGATWINIPSTTAGSVSYTPAGGLTANNVQAAISELASTKVGFSGSNLLGGRLVVGSIDPNNYGRLGTTNATLGGVFAIATDTNTVALMQANTSKVSFGSISNHPVSLKVNNVDVVDITDTQYTFNGLNVGIGAINAGSIGQLGNIGNSERTIFSQHTAGATSIMRAGAVSATLGTTTNHPVSLIVNGVDYLRMNVNSTIDIFQRTLVTGGIVSRMPLGLVMNTTSGNFACFEATGIDNSGTVGPALIAFHRPNQYAVYFGLDTDNKIKIGGWSLGATKHEVLHSGNISSYVLGGGQIRTSFNNTQRLFNNDYANNTSAPRTIFANVNSASGSRAVELVINGVASAYDIAVAANCHATVWGVVQPGETYRINTTGGFVYWGELG